MPTSIKRIKGNNYLYYTYYINGKRHDVYCGPAEKPESKEKALESELEYVQSQNKYYADLSQKLEKRLKHD